MKVYAVITAGASQESGIEVSTSTSLFSTPAKARDFELRQLKDDWDLTEEYELDDESIEYDEDQKRYLKKVKKWDGSEPIYFEHSDIETGDCRTMRAIVVDEE